MNRSIVLSEHRKYGPGPCAELARCAFNGSGHESALRALREKRKLDVREYRSGLCIQTFSHVGKITLGDLSITIRPKLAEEDFLHLVGYAYGLELRELPDQTWFDASGEAIQELFIAALYTRVRELTRRGLARRYRSRAEALASPRGRLDVRRWATSTERLRARAPCVHHVRSSDHLLNSVLLSGTELAVSLTQSPARKADLRDSARRLADETRSIPLSAPVLHAARAQLNRLVIGYEQPLALIETLYAGHGASWLDEPHVELSGFLFDMNAFFQELLRKFLDEYLGDDCAVEAEEHLHHLFHYSRNPRNRPAPLLKPDFTVRRGTATWLLDAKYKDLWVHRLPREMLYQLSVYALSQGRGATVAILYPTESPNAREAVLDICDPSSGSVVGRVAVRPVHMNRLAQAVATPERNTAHALARELAFGSGA